MKDMKVLKNGKILYKLDKEKLENRIKDQGYNMSSFSLHVGRSKEFIRQLFSENRKGFVKIELIEYLSRELNIPDPDWLISEEVDVKEIIEENKTIEENIREIKLMLKDMIKPVNDLTIKLKAKPHQKVYYLHYIENKNYYIIYDGNICGYFISAKLNVIYKIEHSITKSRYDVKEENVFLTLKEAQNAQSQLQNLEKAG